ncbi:hypothetical protein [Thiobacter aerophilum]|uniref:DUF7931 domain-containing protein n=1 Tax=Thiobacter aerophilum TaxID=3121275 RepID=A0ABV0EJL6_9BURK
MAEETPSAGTFDVPSGYRCAIDHLILAARREICIFDRNLEGAGFDDPVRSEALRRLLLMGRDNRLRIVLHDTARLPRREPRLMNLLRQFSHAVSIHETEREARALYDGIMVADGAHYVHRFHFDHARGRWGLEQPEHAQELKRRFEEIWQASRPALAATTLGL